MKRTILPALAAALAIGGAAPALAQQSGQWGQSGQQQQFGQQGQQPGDMQGRDPWRADGQVQGQQQWTQQPIGQGQQQMGQQQMGQQQGGQQQQVGQGHQRLVQVLRQAGYQDIEEIGHNVLRARSPEGEMVFVQIQDAQATGTVGGGGGGGNQQMFGFQEGRTFGPQFGGGQHGGTTGQGGGGQQGGQGQQQRN